MKHDTISLREVIMKKRYDEERYGNPKRFGSLGELIYWVHWEETPEGDYFWRTLYISVRKRLPEARDIKLRNKSWR